MSSDHAPDAVVVLVTHPDLEAARALARELVEERLAACVQVLPGVVSTFRWEGQVDSAEEVRIEIKTVPGRLLELERLLVERHPYDVPEMVVLPVIDGLDAYIHWIRTSTT